MSNYTKVMSYHISNIFKKQLIKKMGDKLDEFIFTGEITSNDDVKQYSEEVPIIIPIEGVPIDEDLIKDLTNVWPVDVDKPKNFEKLDKEKKDGWGKYTTIPIKWYSNITYADGNPQLHEITLLAQLLSIYEKILLLEEDDEIQFMTDKSVIIETSYDEIQYLINFNKSLINSSLSGLEKLNLIKIMNNGLKELSIKLYMDNIIKISNYDAES